jgi:hypothetical protein
MDITVGEHKFLGNTYKFPGGVKWNDITATFVDTENDQIIQTLLREKDGIRQHCCHGRSHRGSARAAGADVTLVNTNEQRLDIEQYRPFDAVAFGSPDYYSYIAGGLKVFVDDWYIARKSNRRGLEGKPYGLFYSHGGGGDVRGPLEELFSRMGTQAETRGGRMAALPKARET